MPGENESTSTAEPEVSTSTSDGEPESGTGTGSDTESPQPDISEDPREARLRANREGRLMEELRVEREARARYEGMLAAQQQQRQPVQQPAPVEDEDSLTEAETQEYYNAMAVGNTAELRRLDRLRSSRIKTSAARTFAGVLQGINSQAQATDAVVGPLQKVDWNSPLGHETRAQYHRLAREMNVNMPPDQHGRPQWHPVVARMALEAANGKIEGQRRTSREDNSHDEARSSSSEGGSPAAKPKASGKDRVYLTAAEKRACSQWAKIDKVSQEKAERNYWDKLKAQRPGETARRTSSGRAE